MFLTNISNLALSANQVLDNVCAILYGITLSTAFQSCKMYEQRHVAKLRSNTTITLLETQMCFLACGKEDLCSHCRWKITGQFLTCVTPSRELHERTKCLRLEHRSPRLFQYVLGHDHYLHMPRWGWTCPGQFAICINCGIPACPFVNISSAEFLTRSFRSIEFHFLRDRQSANSTSNPNVKCNRLRLTIILRQRLHNNFDDRLAERYIVI